MGDIFKAEVSEDAYELQAIVRNKCLFYVLYYLYIAYKLSCCSYEITCIILYIDRKYH